MSDPDNNFDDEVSVVPNSKSIQHEYLKSHSMPDTEHAASPLLMPDA